MTWHIKDYGLTVRQLEERYGGTSDDEHRGYPIGAWVRSVNLDNTRLGYWDWVHYQLTLEREELDADSPYT